MKRNFVRTTYLSSWTTIRLLSEDFLHYRNAKDKSQANAHIYTRSTLFMACEHCRASLCCRTKQQLRALLSHSTTARHRLTILRCTSTLALGAMRSVENNGNVVQKCSLAACKLAITNLNLQPHILPIDSFARQLGFANVSSAIEFAQQHRQYVEVSLDKVIFVRSHYDMAHMSTPDDGDASTVHKLRKCDEDLLVSDQ